MSNQRVSPEKRDRGLAFHPPKKLRQEGLELQNDLDYVARHRGNKRVGGGARWFSPYLTQRRKRDTLAADTLYKKAGLYPIPGRGAPQLTRNLGPSQSLWPPSRQPDLYNRALRGQTP